MPDKLKVLWGLTGSVASTLTPKIIKDASEKYDLKMVATSAAEFFFNYSDLAYFSVSLYNDDHEWKWEDPCFFGQYRDLWQKNDPVLHIELRDWADVLVIAPLTANTLAKMANGICDNLLTSVVRAWPREKPIIIAPAMNTVMWESPFTNCHLKTLKEIFDITIVNPVEKELACGDVGIGAMAHLNTIYEAIDNSNKWFFPLEECNGIPIGEHPGAFGVQRKHSKHCGVDLYTKERSRVYAVETGKVVAIEPFTGKIDGSDWWEDTYCVLVEGKNGETVCYGEVEPMWGIKVGKFVKKGQCIADIIPVLKEGKERPDIPGHSRSMLHLELYKNKTNVPSNGWDNSQHLGLTDPTEFLLNAINKPENVKILGVPKT